MDKGLSVAMDRPSVLMSTPFLDSEHPEVRAFAESRAGSSGSRREQAVRLYYAVRDEIRYDPYGAGLDVESLRASATLARGRGWCVAKSVLLAAVCRAIEIPARLGFADVRNHLSTARMREQMKTDVFYWHGYTSIQSEPDSGWVKATPAFNIELCEKFGFHALDFDGVEDSLYHPFDREGRQHMEYVHDRGEFDDVPLEAILETFADHYASILADGKKGEALGGAADFDRDVELETRGRQ